MTFLFGETREVRPESVVPEDVRGLRGSVANELQQASQGLFSGEISPIVLERIIGPIRDLFRQRRGETLAQAKETAGTLTGSGFANILGTAAGRSLTEEEAIISQLIDQERSRLLQGILGFSTAGIGIGTPQLFREQGLLETLGSAAASAAPFFAPGAAAAGPGAGGAAGGPPFGFPGISSRRFKKDIVDAPDEKEELSKLLALRSVSFRYKEPGTELPHDLQYGLIAEEVDDVLPQLVVHDSKGRPAGVHYARLCVMLLNNLRELALAEAT